MDTNNICVHCGGTEGHFVEERGQVQHFYKDNCIVHLSRRVEAVEAERGAALAVTETRLEFAEAENARLWAAFDRIKTDLGLPNEATTDDIVARIEAADAKIAQLEGQIARQAFVTNRRPADETDVDVLLVAQWVPGIVPEAHGRWRDRHYETLKGVLGWRPRVEE
jgi:hypothetical protein